MSQRPGAYHCVELRLAVAIPFGPFKGVPYRKGMLEGNCCGLRVPCTVWLLVMLWRGSRVESTQCGVCSPILGAPGP